MSLAPPPSWPICTCTHNGIRCSANKLHESRASHRSLWPPADKCNRPSASDGSRAAARPTIADSRVYSRQAERRPLEPHSRHKIHCLFNIGSLFVPWQRLRARNNKRPCALPLALVIRTPSALARELTREPSAPTRREASGRQVAALRFRVGARLIGAPLGANWAWRREVTRG